MRTKGYNYLLGINDLLWVVCAIISIFYDNLFIMTVVVLTTIVYAVDLFIKFKQMNYKFLSFVKKYWLDIIFLIPLCKFFRAFRVVKAGKILKLISFCDTAQDLTELTVRCFNLIKKKFKKPIDKK